ncbi:Uncharacterised protein [Klebsiella michiganensis]|nr:Uncharacterised protein [Klebsiella michiganensis]
MKFLRKLILWLLIALLVVIIAAYFLLQTPVGRAPGQRLAKRRYRLEGLFQQDGP